MTEEFVVEKEMALTYADFFRIIPNALGSDDFKTFDTGIILTIGDKRQTITLGPERIRQIALMRIPACDVRLEYSGYSKPEQEAALDLFNRRFQKGGG